MRVKVSWTIPNILTSIRLLAIPFMAVCIYLSGEPGQTGQTYSIAAFYFFVAIWITDAADGFIARHYNQVTEFGKIYDPFVDKLFQFTTAFMMFLIGRLPLWVVIFIIAKELTMILGGAYLLHKHKIVVHSKWYGKMSTVLFVLALASVFFIPHRMLYIINYIFILPVLMSTYATINYGITLIKDSSKLADSDLKRQEESEGMKGT